MKMTDVRRDKMGNQLPFCFLFIVQYLKEVWVCSTQPVGEERERERERERDETIG